MAKHLGRIFGPFGQVIGMINDVLGAGGHQPSRRELERALEELEQAGYEVAEERWKPKPPPIPPPQVPSVPAPGKRPPPLPPRHRQQPPPLPPSRSMPAPTGRSGIEDEWPEEHGIEVLPVRIGGRYDVGNVPEGIRYSPIIYTPESSNVYAFWYDYDNKMLYVQYRAEGETVDIRRGISVCSGEEYSYGARANVAGPIYSYGGRGTPFPQHMFDAMTRAKSKGKFIWANIRECGTIHGHQYPYTLTAMPDKVQRVPRKATARGLRVRTVPHVGSGPRGGRRSRPA